MVFLNIFIFSAKTSIIVLDGVFTKQDMLSENTIENSKHISLSNARETVFYSELLGNKLPSFLNARGCAPCAILSARVSGSYRCFLHRGYASVKRYTHAVDKCELSPLSQRLHWFMVIVRTHLYIRQKAQV